MPVVDFHIHAYDWPISSPASFVEFMDREMARAYGSFAKFVERYTTGAAYERVLDEALRPVPAATPARIGIQLTVPPFSRVAPTASAIPTIETTLPRRAVSTALSILSPRMKRMDAVR